MTEKQIIMLEEVIENVNDEKEMLKIALKCVNCEHRDLLVNFLSEKYSGTTTTIGRIGGWGGMPSPTPIKNKKDVKIDGVEYTKNFLCPKCKSSLIILDKEFTKNNIVRML